MDIIERLYTAIETGTHTEGFSGVVLASRADKELYFKALGFAHRAHKILNTRNTRFATASATKMFTAVAVLQHIQEKRISLDTKVVDYLALKKTRISKDIMVSHLLSHTSGMGDYFDDNEPDAYEKLWQNIPNYRVRNLADLLPLFIDKPPIFSPGEKFQYCDAGYILLGLIIEKASGMSYFDYVRQNIFERAGMKDSNFLSLVEINAETAEGYIPIKTTTGKITGWKKNIYAVPVLGASDGGAFITADDGRRFMHALRRKKLLGESMTEEVLIPRIDDSGGWKYGYGMWFYTDGKNGIIRYGHSGEDPGASCRIYYYPSADIDIILLGNKSLCAGAMMEKINEAIVGKNILSCN